MKIYLKTREEISLMREANLLVADVLDAVEAAARPGVSTWELNEVAARRLETLGGQSAFLGYHGYPAVLCTSPNEVVVHGIPRADVELKEGDILSIDFGAFVKGFCGDSARTIPVGKISVECKQLIDATRRALDLAIEKCVPGNRLEDIGSAVQSHVERLGYSVVESFVGHGIGRAMHEDPPVPNYGTAGRGLRLKAGMVLAIEPMVNVGRREVVILPDRWTAVTKDGSLSAHFEHSVAVMDDDPYVLSRA